jgi:hypothetical protein
VAITPKVFDTLLFLVANAGRPVSREELIKTVWPDTFVEEGNLNYNIQLPAKLNAWRHELMQLLKKIDPSKPSQESVAATIGRLSQSRTIPRHIAALMRVITEMRNKAEYEANLVSDSEIMAVIAAYKAVNQWAQTQRLVG